MIPPGPPPTHCASAPEVRAIVAAAIDARAMNFERIISLLLSAF